MWGITISQSCQKVQLERSQSYRSDRNQGASDDGAYGADSYEDQVNPCCEAIDAKKGEFNIVEVHLLVQSDLLGNDWPGHGYG